MVADNKTRSTDVDRGTVEVLMSGKMTSTSMEQIDPSDWTDLGEDEGEDLVLQFKRLEEAFSSVRSSQHAVVTQDRRHSMKKDGGWSWVACLCAFTDQLFIFGTLNVYSLFLVKFQAEFDCSTGEGAWLGSMTMGLMKLFGPLSSSLIMRLGNRCVMMLGAFLCGAAILGSSFAPDFLSLFGTLCLPFSLGAAFTITPAVMIPVDYFNKHQTLAMGVVAAGSSVGTVVLAPVMQVMLDHLNWRWTFRIISIFLFALVFLNAFVRPRKRQNPMMYIKKPIFRSIIEDFDLWKNRVFSLWVLATAIVYFGYQIPNIFLASFAATHGITPNEASFVVMAMGGATTLSRLITGKLLTCTLLSRLHFNQTIFVLMGTSYLLLPYVETLRGLYIFAVFRGFLDGAHIVMLPILTSSMVGASKALLGWGYMAGVVSVSYVIGPPMAGYIRDATGNYDMAFIMSGIPLITSGLLLFLLPWAKRTGKSTNILSVVSKVPADRTPSSSVETSSTVEEVVPGPGRKSSTLDRLVKALRHPKHPRMLDTAALIERLEKLPQRSRHGSKDALDERHGHMGLRFRQNKLAEMLSLGVTPGFVTPSCMAAITTPTVSVATNSRELVTSMSLPHGMTPGLTPRLIAIHSSAHVPLRGILKRPSSEPTLFTPSLTETMIQARAKRHIQLGKVRDQPGVKSPDLENTSKLYDARGSQEMGSLETEQSVSLVVSKCCNSFDDDDSNSVSLSVPKTSNEMAKLNSAPPATSEQRTETHSISLHTKMDFQPQYNTEPIEMLQGYSTYMTMHSDRVNQSELGARATDTCHTSCSSQSEDRALNGVRSPSPWAMDSSEMKTS